MSDILYSHPAKISIAKLMEATDYFSGVGEKKAKIIVDNLSTSEFNSVFSINPTIESMLFMQRINGISLATINSLVAGMNQFIKFLSNSYVSFYIKEEKEIGSSLSNLSVCFTGVRDAELQKHIEDNGGKVVSGVSKNTTHLVVDDLNTSSSKAKKAKELNIKLLTIKQARELWYF